MKPKSMIAYVRVSSVGSRDVESERYQTESTQLDEIERWGRERSVNIVSGPEFVDRDVSGAKAERPGFEAALAEVDAGRADGIVVATLDRFSRQSTIDALKRVQEVQDAGGAIASAGGEVPVDPTTPAGEFQLTLFASIARLQWREYDRRWRVAKTRAAERGVQIARAPLGYQHGEDGRLEPSPLAPHITEMFRLAASEGVRPAQRYMRAADGEAPERRWQMQNLRRTLGRRVYLGELGWNGGAVLKDAHEPLTDLATWTRAQSDPRWAKGPNASFALTGGPARCGTCGGEMVGTKSGSKRKYRCASGGGRRHPVDCAVKAWVDADGLEAYALELLVLEAEAREMDPERHPEVLPEAPRGGDVTEAEVELEAAQLRRAEFAAADLDVSPEAWSARALALDAAVAAAEQDYQAALLAAAPEALVPKSVEIREAGVEGLSGFLDRLGLVVRVEANRMPIPDRVHLVALG